MTAMNMGTAPADDFIPAPAGSGDSVSNAIDSGTNVVVEAVTQEPGSSSIGQTEAILGIVALIALAGLLLLVRSAVRKSLIAGRATIDHANAAAWSWYLGLLAFGALVIAGIVGGLFASTMFIVTTVAVLIVSIAVALMLTSRARRSS